MDVQQSARAAGSLGMRAAALILLVAAPWLRAEEAWRSQLQPAEPGSFPVVRSFTGEFVFGWSGVEAARAKAEVRVEGDRIVVQVQGGTDGMARKLWKLDASHYAIISKEGLRSQYFRQVEKYSNRTITTEAVFKPEGIWRQRQVTPDPKGAAKWKRIKVEPLRDIIAAMFFIRSQPLANGDRVVLAAFPGDSPFFVEAAVVGRTQLDVAGVKRKAIKLGLTIRRIDTKNENRLAEHDKFRGGSVWISDDADRIPLRAEVNIFIGYVFGQLADIRFDSGAPRKRGR